MTETKPQILTVQRLVKATAQEAFDAWTTAATVRQWWGGWEAGSAPEMQIEAAPGAPWRFAMSFGDGVQWVSGEVTAVQAPSVLEFTFVWEGAEFAPTPVVVTFGEVEGGCEVKLVHDISTGGNACEDGWGWSLDCLVGHFEQS